VPRVPDYDAMRDGLQAAIPFNTHVGLEVVEVADGRGVVRLPDEAHLHNHVGSQHAAGLFAAGEAASGAAFMGAFAEHLAGVVPLARGAEIDYRKLAKGVITATATLDADVDVLLERLESDGKVQFPVSIEMTDADGQVVAGMTVNWHVRKSG
jgi:acyl-coenzyme A thioesterase PaaI-like protein